MAVPHRPSILLASAMLLWALGCGGGASAPTPGSTNPPPGSATPTITSFTAAQSVLDVGASTQLTAVFSNGTGSITPGIGAVTSGVAVTVAPSATARYLLTVTDASGHLATQPLILGVRKVPFELVSLGATGVAASWGSYLARQSVSADGRFVAFASMDGSLVAGDTNGAIDIFVRDRQLGTTTCVSRAFDGSASNGYSDYPSISADGRFVVFESHATNLVTGVSPTRSYADIYRHDLLNHTTLCVSVDSSGLLGNGSSFRPSLSADGRLVAFGSDAKLSAEVPTQSVVYLRDTVTNLTSLASRKPNGTWVQGSNPVISADGSKLIFESFSDPLGLGLGHWQFYSHELATGAISLVSASATGTPREQGNESISRGVVPSVSQNGRFVTFCTTASNLVPGATSGIQNVFVKDTQTGEIALLSQNAAGAFGNGESVSSQGGRASISANGDWVTYNTSATNLIGGQYSTMAVNIFTGETEVLQAGGGFVGDTDPAISPDAYGRFVAIVAGEHLDPRYAYRGLFLKDRHVAPVAAVGLVQAVSLGATVILDGSGSSPSVNPKPFPVAPPLTYVWTQTDGPSVSFTAPGTAKPSFTAAVAGTYVFQLVVNDTIEDSLPVLTIVKVL